MKRTICVILLVVLVLGAAVCGCGHSAPASPSGSSGDQSKEEWSDRSEGVSSSVVGLHNHVSLAGAQQWKKPEEFVPKLEDFYASPFNPETDMPVTRDFTPVDRISVSGKYAMPVVTNETPLDEMIVTISGELLRICESMLGNGVADSNSIPLRDLWGETQTLDYIPITFLRKTGESSYYTVCKVDGGGYAYFFFDRLRDSETGEYLTTDKTDVYFYGAIYAEEMHSYAEFADIRVYDSIDRVAEIDHKTYFEKDLLEMAWEAEKEYNERDGGVVYYPREALFSTLHLLNDGILQIAYQYNDPEFEEVYDKNKDPAYTYDYSNYMIINMQYYPDYMVTPYYRLGESDMGFYNVASNLRVLPIDWQSAH